MGQDFWRWFVASQAFYVQIRGDGLHRLVEVQTCQGHPSNAIRREIPGLGDHDVGGVGGNTKGFDMLPSAGGLSVHMELVRRGRSLVIMLEHNIDVLGAGLSVKRR